MKINRGRSGLSGTRFERKNLNMYFQYIKAIYIALNKDSFFLRSQERAPHDLHLHLYIDEKNAFKSDNDLLVQ